MGERRETLTRDSSFAGTTIGRPVANAASNSARPSTVDSPASPVRDNRDVSAVAVIPLSSSHRPQANETAGGTGPAHINLSCAIVGKLYGLDGYHRKELARRARILREQFLTKLDAKAQYDIPVEKLKALFD